MYLEFVNVYMMERDGEGWKKPVAEVEQCFVVKSYVFVGSYFNVNNIRGKCKETCAKQIGKMKHGDIRINRLNL